MSVSINNVQPTTIETTKPAFKGKWSKTDQGNPYYKTNSGTVAGGIMAIPAALVWLKKLWYKEPLSSDLAKEKDMLKEIGVDKTYDKFFKKFGFKNMDDAVKQGIEQNKRLKKYAIPFALIAAGATIGCGVLVDHLRNKKAKEKADYVKQVGVKKAVVENGDIALSNKGRAYYESNIGAKYGAILGAGCGLIESVMTAGKFKMAGLLNMIPMAIGGWIMGKIADSNTNKDARKHA